MVKSESGHEVVEYFKSSGIEWKNYITFKVDHDGKIMDTDSAYVL